MTLNISLLSFSYKKGLPIDESGNGGGFVFDCRGLTNPGREAQYKCRTGRDSDVIEYLRANSLADSFVERAAALVHVTIENYLARSFSHLQIAFGCTGGQHRSVYCAEQLAKMLIDKYGQSVSLAVTHRDMPRF